MTGRLSRIPLRTQLIGLLLATVALVVVATSLAAVAGLRSYLVDRIDAQLASSLSLAQTAGGPPAPRPGGRERGPGRQDVAVTVLRYDVEGVLDARAATRLALLGGPDVPQLANRADLAALSGRPVDVDGLNGGRWRVLAGPDRLDGGTVLVAAPLDGVQDTASQLLVINSGIGLLALAGAGVLAWLAVRRSLRPLLAVGATAQAIAAGDLTVRLPAGDSRTEVGSLATSFNVMVDRFESAFTAQQHSQMQARASEERMRRFVADASHELRTPLTSIRGFAELFRQGAASEPEQLERVMRRIEDEAARMGLLVEDLLLLARLDQARPLRREPVDLLAVVTDVTHDADVLHGDHHRVRLTAPTGPGRSVVVGDDARLRQVVANLVSNAVTHTPAGTRVEVRLTSTAQHVTVEVRDTGAGMAPDVAARVFERFYRADPARSRSFPQASGSGLGLSIVAALVAAQDGTVEVDSTPGVGTSFRVILPAAP